MTPGRLYSMYSAEPLPHFVDEYLAYLYEINPTTATFDGVHVHDDLLEDFGRPGYRRADPDARRLCPASRRHRSRAPDRYRTARAAGARIEHSRPAFRARRGPHVGAQPAALCRHAGDQPCRAGALRLRAARRARPPRALEAAAGAAAHAGRTRQYQGSARNLREGRAREPARDAAFHSRGSAARLRQSRRPPPARRSRRRVDGGLEPISSYVEYLETDLAPRSRARSVSDANDSSGSSASTKASRSARTKLLAIATRELHTTQEEFRRVASRVNGGDPVAAWQKTKADHPPAGQLVAVAAAAAGRARSTSSPAANRHDARGRAG